jgi:hypothetical protein
VNVGLAREPIERPGARIIILDDDDRRLLFRYEND